jgi:urease accessory protein
MALVHLHNVSGGVLAGDHLALTAWVGPQARVQLTTPGATRIYRHQESRPLATQVNHFEVEKDGLLEYLPEALIPFAGARYRQITQVQLAVGAGLFWWEIIAPGRETRQEILAYEALEMAVDIEVPTQPIAIERLRLHPASQPPASPVRLGAYPYFATFYICRVGLPPSIWLALETELAELSRQETSELLWAASALTSDGLVVRLFSQTGRAIHAQLISLWQLAKTRLYNEAIILPRKLY